MRLVLACILLVAASGSPQAHGEEKPGTPASARAYPLPGANGPVSLDYIAVDRAKRQVWVPAGDTGSVDVFDASTNEFHRIEGFKVAEREAHGRKRKLGPSSAAMGEGVVYVGNRATSEVCTIDEKTLHVGKCVKLDSPPDGLAYVAATKELWITTPNEQSLTLLDASLKPLQKIKLPGDPEGYAVDNARGLFFTNLEDKDGTLVIDLHTREVKAKWSPGCGEAGPRQLALDTDQQWAIVACTDHVVVLDTAHGGKQLAKAETGAGVDNIDYLPSKRQVFVAAGKTGKLTVFSVGAGGALTPVATIDTAIGARTVAVDAQGTAYLPDPMSGRLLVAAPVR